MIFLGIVILIFTACEFEGNSLVINMNYEKKANQLVNELISSIENKKNGKPMALRPVYCKFHRFCSSAYFDKRLCVERGKRVQVVVSYMLRSLHSVVCPGSICKMGTLQRERCQKPQRVQEE